MRLKLWNVSIFFPATIKHGAMINFSVKRLVIFVYAATYSRRVRESRTGSQKSGAPYLIETDLRSLSVSFTVSHACPIHSCSHSWASASARASSRCFPRKACSASTSALPASSSASFRALAACSSASLSACRSRRAFSAASRLIL